MRTRRLLTLAAAVLLLTGFLLWIRQGSRPHVLLITLDTTRADRLGCYGYPAGRTPVLDSLANAGVLCERAFTVAPLTLPAHASLLTGLYPAETGVRRNGRERLSVDIPTLAQILSDQGYDTGAFVASFVLDSKFGLDRGFDLYDDQLDEIPTAISPADSISPEDRRRDGSLVVDAATAWLNRWHWRPTFCWVHLYDPHAPCQPRTELFGDEFADRPYDAEIAYVDQQVGRLLQLLKARRLDASTLVVVVGDHGEGLGEHLEQSHSLTLYHSTMHVPLILRYPAKVPGGNRVAASVSVVDVLPTMLDLLDLPEPQNVTGKSIRAALEGKTVQSTACLGATDDPFDVYGCAPLRSLTDGQWKFIRSTRVELYDLAADFRELQNLAESRPDQVREMERRLDEFESSLRVRDDTPVSLSAAERRILESLGYTGTAIAGGTPQTPADGGLPDIKDILLLESRMEDAVKRFHAGETAGAISLLQEIVHRAPTHAPAVWSLAWALWRQSRHDEAMGVFRALLQIRPDCHTAHYGLGFMLLQRDDLRGAAGEFLKTIETDPQYVEAHFHLAEALLASGQVDEAQARLETVLQLDPSHAGAVQLSAFIESSAARREAAVAEYRQALREAAAAFQAADGGARVPLSPHSH